MKRRHIGNAANPAAERKGATEAVAASYTMVSSPSGGVPLPNLTEHLRSEVPT